MMVPVFILLPLLGAIFLATVGRRWDRRTCGGVTMAWLFFTIVCFRPSIGQEIDLPWIPEAGIRFRFVVDGVSSVFLLLASVVVFVACATMCLTGRGERRFYILSLVMLSALDGVFTARNFVPWFLCWELTLIPAWLLVRDAGTPAAVKAAMRFFVVTLGGSAFLLVGFLALQFSVGTMDFDELGRLASEGLLIPRVEFAFGFVGASGHAVLAVIAAAVFLGLAVKVPVFPLHGWLPSAYAEAPTPVTMLLTGVLSKMGVYGLLRIILPVFPEVLPSMAPTLMWLAVMTVLTGVLAALVQSDMKRMLAYSSVNHLGYCVVAIIAVAAGSTDRASVAAAVSGTVLQAFNHGVIACALFFGVSILESRGDGRRGLGDFGGLREGMPVFSGFFGLAAFASLGLPGLSGFVGEFLMFRGVFAMNPWAASVSALGLLLTAVFLLRMIRVVMWGPPKASIGKWSDLSGEERWIAGLLIFLMVVPGLVPGVLLDPANKLIVPLLDGLCPPP